MAFASSQPTVVGPRKRSFRRRGAIAVLLALLMIAFLASVAFTVDVAYLHLTNAELRAATDASAKAAASTLGRTHDERQARQAAIQIAAANEVAGKPLVLTPRNIVFGSGTPQPDGTILFRPNGTPIGAAQVSVRIGNNSPNAPVGLFYGKLLGTGLYSTGQTAVAAHLYREIALVVDRSGSMSGSKIRDLKSAVSVFLDTLEDTPYEEPIGLASYSSRSRIDKQLTTNMQVLENKMRAMHANGWTAIGAGILDGRAILNRGSSTRFVEKTIILMTDGNHNTGVSPISAARTAANDGIVVHTITFGSGADQRLMRQVANICGGNHYHAPTGRDLIDIYEYIALTMTTVLTE